MIVFLNGKFVPEEQALVSIFDRSFLYGDGLFETLRVCHGQPFRWTQHIERLERGAALLRLRLPFSPEELRKFADELISRNRMPESVLRVHVSRGVGPRGYSIKQADRPSLTMSLHAAPQADPQNPPHWRLITSSIRLPAGDPLTNQKTCNKLPHILARAEAEERGADEALLLNTHGEVAEGAACNVFWLEGGTVCTPLLTAGALPGITRAVVLELCGALGLPAREQAATPQTLRASGGVFLTLSTLGIVEAVSLDGEPLPSVARLPALRGAYERLVEKETGQEV